MNDWKLDMGVGEDGLVEGPYQGVETYYCPLEAVLEAEHFLCVIGDNGGTNVEIRIPVQQMIYSGWTPPTDYVERIRNQADV